MKATHIYISKDGIPMAPIEKVPHFANWPIAQLDHHSLFNVEHIKKNAVPIREEDRYTDWINDLIIGGIRDTFHAVEPYEFEEETGYYSYDTIDQYGASMSQGTMRVAKIIRPGSEDCKDAAFIYDRETNEVMSWPRFCEAYKDKHGVAPVILNKNSILPVSCPCSVNCLQIPNFICKGLQPKEKSKSDEMKEQFKKAFEDKEQFIETEVELCPCEIETKLGLPTASMCFACTGKQKYIKRVSFKLALPK